MHLKRKISLLLECSVTTTTKKNSPSEMQRVFFFNVLYHCRSLAVGHQYSSLGSQPILCGSIPGLVPKQLRFCRNYVEIMPSVAEGVKIGIQECQHQFRGRRWNCTTINDNLAIFGPVLDKGTNTRVHLFQSWRIDGISSNVYR